jgi:hypothetical protein
MFAAILLYLVIMITYVVIRPVISYNEDGTPKAFGVGDGHTLFPLWIVAILAGTMVAFLHTYIVM